jgi:hypothetical protein
MGRGTDRAGTHTWTGHIELGVERSSPAFRYQTKAHLDRHSVRLPGRDILKKL